MKLILLPKLDLSLVSRFRLVGEGLNPEKINIKAFLVSICSARCQE